MQEEARASRVRDEVEHEKDKDGVRQRVLQEHEIRVSRVDKEAQFAKEDAKRMLDRYEAEVRERFE